jgi:hypothetical protein
MNLQYTSISIEWKDFVLARINESHKVNAQFLGSI